MDTYAAASESQLTSQFSHSMPANSEWCQSRAQARFYPSGSNVYGPSGTRVCRVPLTADGFIDPYSVVFHQTVRNKENTDMTQLNFAPAYWQRMRLFAGGVEIESIQDYNRLYYTMALLGPKAHLKEDMVIASKKPGQIILASSSMKQSFPLWTGLMSQHRALPARYLNLVVELEAVSDASDVADKDWEINQCFITADVMTLDTALSSAYAAHLLTEGKQLIIPFTGMIQQSYTVTDENWQIAISRSVSKMKAMFLTFKSGDKKKCIDLKFPGVTEDGLTLQCQLGARQFPETRAEGISELFPRLMEAAGNHTSTMSTTSIDVANDKYTNDEFICGTSFQRVLSDSQEGHLSGLSSKQGDLLTIRTTGVNTGGNVHPKVNEAFVTIAHDALLVVSSEGVQILT